MKRVMHTMPLTELRRLFEYRSGEVFWKVDRRHANKGDVVGSVHAATGYLITSVRGKSFRVHRIAWALVHGEWPVDQLDHIFGERASVNVRLLREATDGLNRQNRTVRNSNNSSGFPGVCYDSRRNKWYAQIKLDYKRKWLGYFDNPEDAAVAYESARASLHPFSNPAARISNHAR